jgi:hypothetical protein
MQILALALLILIGVAVVAGVYLNITQRTATIGRDIQGMQYEIEELQLSNADLETRLAYLTSGTQMHVRALELGFQPIERDQIEYLVVPGYAEKRAAVIAPPPEPVETYAASLPFSYTESLLDWVKVSVVPMFQNLLEVNQ